MQIDKNRDEIVVSIYDKNTIKLEIGQKVTASFPEDSILIFKDA